ncbi:MAG: hypothetical protein LBQ47_03305, partial [Endomicrobium sp.]|nr:hypothetical protein [Endomicrobium sp.]
MKKAIASLTALIFMHSVISQSVFAAMPQTQSLPSPKILSVGEPVISYSFGKINAGSVFGDPALQKRIIVNIQDLHCNPQVQRNIAEILKGLQEKYGLNAIYAEGAYSDINTAWLKDIDKDKQPALLDALLNSGRLSASEYYCALSENQTIKGLEDAQIHSSNLIKFGNILEKQSYYKEQILLLDNELKLIKNKYFNFDNKRFNLLLEHYKNGKITPAKYYSTLIKYIDKANKGQDRYDSLYYINLDAYPNVKRYIVINNMAKLLNYKQITKQLRRFIDELKSKLPYSAYVDLTAKTKNFTNLSDLYLYIPALLKDYNIVLDDSQSDLKLFFDYAQKEKDFNPLDLVKEEKRLIEKIRLGLSKDKSELEISFAADFYGYFKDYLSASIASDDYAYFKEYFGKFKSVWEKYVYESVLSGLESDFIEISGFYDTNFKRDEVFSNKLLLDKNQTAQKTDVSDLSAAELANILKNASVTAVITGGFHSEGLQNACENNNVSYITITPAIADLGNSNEVYTKLAKQQAKLLADNLTAADIPAPQTTPQRQSGLTASQNAISLALGSNNAKIKFNNNVADVEFNGETLKLQWDGKNFSLIENGAISQESKIFSSDVKKQILSNLKNLTQLGNPSALISSQLVFSLVKAFSSFGANSGFLSGNGLIWEIASNGQLIESIKKENINLNELSSFPDTLQKYIALHTSKKEQGDPLNNAILNLILNNKTTNDLLLDLLKTLKIYQPESPAAIEQPAEADAEETYEDKIETINKQLEKLINDVASITDIRDTKLAKLSRGFIVNLNMYIRYKNNYAKDDINKKINEINAKLKERHAPIILKSVFSQSSIRNCVYFKDSKQLITFQSIGFDGELMPDAEPLEKRIKNYDAFSKEEFVRVFETNVSVLTDIKQIIKNNDVSSAIRLLSFSDNINVSFYLFSHFIDNTQFLERVLQNDSIAIEIKLYAYAKAKSLEMNISNVITRKLQIQSEKLIIDKAIRETPKLIINPKIKKIKDFAANIMPKFISNVINTLIEDIIDNKAHYMATGDELFSDEILVSYNVAVSLRLLKLSSKTGNKLFFQKLLKAGWIKHLSGGAHVDLVYALSVKNSKRSYLAGSIAHELGHNLLYAKLSNWENFLTNPVKNEFNIDNSGIIDEFYAQLHNHILTNDAGFGSIVIEDALRNLTRMKNEKNNISLKDRHTGGYSLLYMFDELVDLSKTKNSLNLATALENVLYSYLQQSKKFRQDNPYAIYDYILEVIEEYGRISKEDVSKIIEYLNTERATFEVQEEKAIIPPLDNIPHDLRLNKKEKADGKKESIAGNLAPAGNENLSKLQLPLISWILDKLPLSDNKKAAIAARLEIVFFFAAFVFPSFAAVFIGWHGRAGMIERYRAFGKIQERTFAALPEALKAAILNAGNLNFIKRISLLAVLIVSPKARAARKVNVRQHISWNLNNNAQLDSDSAGNTDIINFEIPENPKASVGINEYPELLGALSRKSESANLEFQQKIQDKNMEIPKNLEEFNRELQNIFSNLLDAMVRMGKIRE